MFSDNSCPHCGKSDKLQVSNKEHKLFWMECFNCYACGPHAFTTREAIRKWKEGDELCKFCGGKEGLIHGFGQLVFWGCVIGSFLAWVA